MKAPSGIFWRKRAALPRWLAATACLLMPLHALRYVAPFTNGDPLWATNVPYGRGGILMSGVVNPPGSTNGVNCTSGTVLSNGTLVLKGIPQTGGGTYYNTFYTGRAAKFLSNFTAKPSAPFGFQVIRTLANLNPWGALIQTNIPQRATMYLWIIQETGISAEWDVYPQFAALYESEVVGNLASLNRSTWGVLSGLPRDFDLTKAARPGGGTVNLADGAITNYLWQYMKWISGAPNQPAGWKEGFANSNAVGLRLTHDGSVIRFWMNPNPVGSNAYPNEWCQIGEQSVAFTTNLRVMIGHEANTAYVANTDLSFTNFLIQTVSEETRLDLAPDEAPLGAPADFALRVRPRFTGDETGFTELKVAFPPGLVPEPDGIAVEGDWGDGVNDGRTAPFRLTAARATNAAVLFRRDANRLHLRFWAAASDRHNAVNPSTLDPTVTIRFRAALRDPRGAEITAEVACEPRDGEGYPGATTGPQRATGRALVRRAERWEARVKAPEVGR